MTADGEAVRTDPLAPNLLPMGTARLSPSSDAQAATSLRPFGLTHVTPVMPAEVSDQSSWIYDFRQQLNVTIDDEMVVFEMPAREQTWSTQRTKVDHQEWDDRVPD